MMVGSGIFIEAIEILGECMLKSFDSFILGVYPCSIAAIMELIGRC